jgi:nitrogen-specific signal transduction histidine kinase
MKARRFNQLLQKDFYEELICGFVSFTAKGKILSVNKTMANWIGISYADLHQRNFKSLLTKSSLIHYNMVVETMLGLNPLVRDVTLQFSAEGGNFDAVLSAESYKNNDGEIFLINATLQKVPDQKKLEKELLREKHYAEKERRKFEFLFNSSPNQLWTADGAGRILMMNQKVMDYFNVTRPGDHFGLGGVYSADRLRSFTAWKSCIAVGKKFERELRFQGAEGEPEWFIVKAEPYHNGDGIIEMWFCSATNINRQKLLQIASQDELKTNLISAYQIVDKNAELFMSFAMKQSHVIRKPLANIMGLVQLLAQEEVSDNLKGMLSLLIDSAEELDQMIKSGHTYPELPGMHEGDLDL